MNVRTFHLTEGFDCFPGWLRAAKNTRFVLAILLPFAALALQWLLWKWIAPFSWFMFFPAVFFSARLGGFRGGMASTVLSIAIVVYFFIPPEFSWEIAGRTHLYSILLFLAMGYLASANQQRLLRAKREAEASFAEARSANEKLDSMYWSMREIEKNQSRAELQTYRQIVATSVDMLAFVDQQRRLVVVNPAYADLFGLSPSDLRERPLAEVIGADNYAKIKPHLDLALAGEAQHFISNPAFPDGLQMIIDATYTPFKTDDEVQGVVISLRDISVLYASEQALKISEERLRLALEGSNDGLWDWDIRSGKVYRSPHYHELIGYPVYKVTEDFTFFEKIVHPEDLPRVRKIIDTHIKGLSPSIEYDFRCITYSGAIKWMRVKGRAVARDAAGTPIRLVGTLADIGKSKESDELMRRQTEELATRNAELERFNRAAVGRELDMIRLKQTVNQLSARLGLEPPYSLAVFAGLRGPEKVTQ